MIKRNISMLAVVLIALGGFAAAQSAGTDAATKAPSATQRPLPPAPLQLNGIAPPQKIQFPAADQKNFTALAPTTQEVNSFLKELWGYDPNRVWQVAGIQTTKAPNVSRVTVLVAEQGVSHSPATTVFFVTPDRQHAIAGSDVIAFGTHPFDAIRETLQQRATGPHRGAASKDLMLVEFADLQCPHCKEAAATMDHLATDFPNAHIVFENFPLTSVHPAAEKAAAYGVCVAQQKGNEAFFKYVQAVYDVQAALTTNADEALNNAATKAGATATEVATCAAGASAKAAVASSLKLGEAVGVDQTPMLFINGRAVPVAGIPYTTLKQIVTYSNTESGSAGASTTAVK